MHLFRDEEDERRRSILKSSDSFYLLIKSRALLEKEMILKAYGASFLKSGDRTNMKGNNTHYLSPSHRSWARV